MLEPNNRQLLRDALRPPAGYALDRAIMTTFSLDLMALLTVPVSFTFFQLKDQEGPPQVDPLALLEALRRYAGRIAVFCQAGQIYVPKHVQLLFSYLENSVHEVQAPKGGVFHPKLTLLRYVAEAGGASDEKLAPVVYRLLCSSRNLTFDRSWDTVLILDGVLAQHRTNAFARNHSLSRFVRELPGLSVHPVPERLSTDVNAIADELLKVDFEIPNGFTELEFCPLGLHWTPQWPILKHRRTLAMAPFVDDGFIRRFNNEGIPLGIISRADSLDELAAESVDEVFDAWYMNTAADPIPVDPEQEAREPHVETEASANSSEENVALTPAIQLHGLHAKLFVSDDGWDSHVWTGSANATTAAFERNVEFMVHLTGKKSRCGIASFVEVEDDAGADSDTAEGLDAGVKNDGHLGFSELLVRYHRDDPPLIDGTRKALEHMLDTARYALAGARLVATIERVLDSTAIDGVATPFRVMLTRTSTEPFALPPVVKIRCHPLTLKANSALPVGVPAETPLVVFESLSFEALTSFYAFQITAAKGDLSISCGFVLNLPLIGAPADREGRLLLSLLRNREQLLKYLLMLLADDEESARRLVETMGTDERNHHAAGHEGGFGFPLLEPLLEALDRQPARLDQIARLIEDLQNSPKGRELLSVQFLSVWEPIWAVRKRIRNA